MPRVGRADTYCAVRIAYVIGTRPNIVKMAPVLSALRRRMPAGDHVLIHTGQHYDRLMSEVFLEELPVPSPDHMLGVGSGTHTEQTAGIMAGLEARLEREQPDLVIVSGDVNSTLAAALTTAQLGVPLAHVESGLRSFDRTMPEELNRRLTDHVSDYLFVHCTDARENLLREGIPSERVVFAGNTMIDSLMAMEAAFRTQDVARRLGCEPGRYLLVTLHRPALVDGPLLQAAMEELGRVSKELEVVFPVHPRTRLALEDADADFGPRVRLLDPLPYVEFLSLEATAAAVLTDSGGIQEETTFLGIPCFTLRDNTERPITVAQGTNTLLGLDPARIRDILPALERPQRPTTPLPGWDGQAGERIAAAIERDCSRRHAFAGR
jgi:UDP-N-acetylglucosamine 2-epimerase (non-hydrolysing)